LIVERFDVVRNVGDSNFSVLVDSLFDALFLQTAEEGFCDALTLLWQVWPSGIRQVGHDERIQLANNVPL
jgi:hypothetical protein